jgi:signal transduction histidine kinase
MRERAQMIRASFVIESQPGEGTTITFTWKASEISEDQNTVK